MGLDKVIPGSPFVGLSAGAWNTLMDVAADWRAKQGTLGVESSISQQQSGIITIRNSTETDLDVGAVLGISSTPLILPTDAPNQFKQRPGLIGEAPSTTDHSGGRFAILKTPAPAGKLADAVVSGFAVVQVDLTNTDHAFADIAESDTAKLVSGESGPAAILAIDRGTTGTKWAVVVLRGGSQARRFCRMEEPIYPGDTATATERVWSGSGYEDGDEIEVASLLNFWAITKEVVEFIANGETLVIVSSGRETHFGTLDEDLTYASDADVTVTVDEEEVTVSAMCDQVASGKKLASGSTVCIAYRPAQDPPWEVIYGPCPVNA